MPLEIERKYLVNKAAWEQTEKPAGQLYRQGYIYIDPTRQIRVRQTPGKAFLTIKGESMGAKRSEFEYEIPLEEAQVLLDDFSVSELSKIRYKILFDNKVWEVDEFLGDNEGLIIAEIELSAEDESFNLPGWVAEEVTEDEKYYNANLVQRPYKDW